MPVKSFSKNDAIGILIIAITSFSVGVPIMGIIAVLIRVMCTRVIVVIILAVLIIMMILRAWIIPAQIILTFAPFRQFCSSKSLKYQSGGLHLILIALEKVMTSHYVNEFAGHPR